MGRMTKKERELLKDIKREWAKECEKGELTCFLCGKKIETMKQCSADHWVPLALGGKTEESNLKPAHKFCNSRKSCMSPEEFLKNKEQVLSIKQHKNTNIDKEKKKKKKAKSLSIGDTIYYIKEMVEFPYCETKKGIIIGYDNNNRVLVKEFYATPEDKIESRLISVEPLTKAQAAFIMARYRKEVSILFQNQITR